MKPSILLLSIALLCGSGCGILDSMVADVPEVQVTKQRFDDLQLMVSSLQRAVNAGSIEARDELKKAKLSLNAAATEYEKAKSEAIRDKAEKALLKTDSFLKTIQPILSGIPMVGAGGGILSGLVSAFAALLKKRD